MKTDEHKAPTEADMALGSALCNKLRELSALSPTVRSLLQLEQTARLAREILVASIDPSALKGQGHNLLQVGNVAQYGMAQGLGYDGPLPGGVLAPSSYSENFGAEVLRQLGAAKGETTETKVLDMVAAISFCREKGGKEMNDLADRLEGTLMKAVGDRDTTPPKQLEAPATESSEAAE